MGFSRFEDIEAWQAARRLTRLVFEVTRAASVRGTWAVRDQLERAALSCRNNIAEGFGRRSDADFARFLGICAGSAKEVQSTLYAAMDAGLLTDDDRVALHAVPEEVANKSSALAQYLCTPAGSRRDRTETRSSAGADR